MAFEELARIGVGRVRSTALGAGGTRLAVGSDLGVSMWDTDGLTRRWFVARNAWTTCVSLSEDGTRMATSTPKGQVTVWDVDAGEALWSQPGGGRLCAISRDGGVVVMGSGSITARESTSGERRYELTELSGRLSALVCGERLLAAANVDGEVRVWELATGEPVCVLDGGGSVQDLALSPDEDELLVAGRGWRFFSLPAGDVVEKGQGGPAMQTLPQWIRCAAWGDKPVLAAGRRAMVVPSHAEVGDHISELEQLATDHQRLVVASDKLTVHDTTTLKRLGTLPNVARARHLDASDRLILVGDRQVVTLWTMQDGSPHSVAVLDGHTHSIRDARIVWDEVWTWSAREIIRWRADGTRLETWSGYRHIEGVAVRGSLLAMVTHSREDRTVTLSLRDRGGERVLAKRPEHGKGAQSLVFNGRLLARRQGQEVSVYDVGSGKEVARMDGVVDGDGGLAAGPDHTFVSCTTNGEALRWGPGFRPKVLEGIRGAMGMAPSRGGRWLAARCRVKGRPDRIVIYDHVSNELIALDNPTGAAHWVAWDTYGTHLVAGLGQLDRGGQVVVWDTDGGEILRESTPSAVLSAIFTPDGRYLVVGRGDGLVQVRRAR